MVLYCSESKTNTWSLHHRALVQHVFPDPRPDRYDRSQPQSNDIHEHPHTLQPCDAPHTSTRVHGTGQWTHIGWVPVRLSGERPMLPWNFSLTNVKFLLQVAVKEWKASQAVEEEAALEVAVKETAAAWGTITEQTAGMGVTWLAARPARTWAHSPSPRGPWRRATWVSRHRWASQGSPSRNSHRLVQQTITHWEKTCLA